jgi:arginase
MRRPLLRSVTVIFSPYHVGIRDEAVGAGPGHLRNSGLVSAIRKLGATVHEVEIDPVKDQEGDIGRSFEIYRRTSKLVTAARDADSFPIIISGNCGASVGAFAGLTGSAGLKEEDVGCLWFDAHDDYNVPDTVLSGYFDSMPIAIMAGECWKTLLPTIPGYKPLNLKRLIHCGLRDLSDIERTRVNGSGHPVVWGSTERKVDFPNELGKALENRPQGPDLIHIDLDVLDSTIGQVNKFEPAPGGLSEDDLINCLTMLPAKTTPVSLTIASFDPSFDKEGRIAGIATRGVSSFIKSLMENGLLALEAA